MIKPGYKKGATSLSKGYAKDVNIVNKPTVKVEYDKPEKMPPTLNLSTDDLSAIKGWKVGGKYKLVLEVEQTSMRQGNEYGPTIGSDSDDSSSRVSASFKILSAEEQK